MALFPASVVAVLDSWGVTSNQLGQQEVELLTQILACQTVIAGNGGGGDGSSEGLPSWTYVAGGGIPAAGQFTTDSNSIAGISALNISYTDRNSSALQNLIVGLPINSLILLTEASGTVFLFQITGFSHNVGYAAFSVTPSGSGTFSGNYQLSSFIASNINDILVASGISPTADGTVTPVTSGTTVSGILTNLS